MNVYRIDFRVWEYDQHFPGGWQLTQLKSKIVQARDAYHAGELLRQSDTGRIEIVGADFIVRVELVATKQ